MLLGGVVAFWGKLQACHDSMMHLVRCSWPVQGPGLEERDYSGW